MAYENLKRELSAIDPKQYSDAVAALIHRDASGINEGIIGTFNQEYLGLISGARKAELTIDALTGGNERDNRAFRAGFLTAIVALKEMIDTAELQEQFGDTPPTE